MDLDADGGSVLALLGENGAGKSTLVKILAGDYHRTPGESTFDGEDITGATPLRPRAAGISHDLPGAQDAPPLTVAENISLGRWPTRRGRVDWRPPAAQAVGVLGTLGSDIDPDRPVGIAAHRRASDRRDRPGALGPDAAA